MIERTDLYEITLILKEDGSVVEIEKIIASIAQIKKSTDLQVKQFAYPIGKLTSGHYYAVEFVAETNKISTIESEIKTEKSIIRYLITKALRKNPEPIRTGEYAKKPEGSEAIMAKKPEKRKDDESNSNNLGTLDTQEEKAVVEPKITPEKVKQEKIELPKAKVENKPEEKLVAKKPRVIVKRPKAEKVSADELDKKLEELVKE